MKTTTPPSTDTTVKPFLAVHKWQSYVTLLSGNPVYRRFWLSGVISQLGNWFNYIAIFVLLTKLTGSGHAISWFLIAKFIPTSFLGPAAGVIADRFSRKKILIFCDLSRAALVLCFLLIKSEEHVWLVYVLALIQESIWTFYDPARRATVPNICKDEELNIANALSGATWSIMLSIGAALGGFVSALFGWQTAIILDSLTFLVSAWLLTHTTIAFTPKEQAKNLTWKDYTGYNDLMAGCSYVAGNSKVAALLLVKSGWAISGGGILVLLSIFGEQVLAMPGNTGGGSGILYSFRGVGAAVGPILAWRLLGETKKGMYHSIGLSFFVATLAYLAFSKAPTMAWAMPFVFLGHLGGSIQWVFSTNLLQRMVPNEFRGRVFAAEMALLTLILSFSTYFAGVALEQGLSPRIICTRLALLLIIPGSIWILYTLSLKKKSLQ